MPYAARERDERPHSALSERVDLGYREREERSYTAFPAVCGDFLSLTAVFFLDFFKK